MESEENVLKFDKDKFERMWRKIIKFEKDHANTDTRQNFMIKGIMEIIDEGVETRY